LDFSYRRYISTAATGSPEDIADVAVRGQTPKVTFAPSASYETRPLANGARMSFQLDATYRSDVRFALLPFADPALDRAATSQAHWIVNGRVSLLDLPVSGSRVKFSLWGQNLFNR